MCTSILEAKFVKKKCALYMGKYGISVLCHLRVESSFVMLVQLQSWNLNGWSPSCVPNEPFWVYEPSIWHEEFFFQFHWNTFRDLKWHPLGRIFICPCADVVLWRFIGIKGIYWDSCGYGLDMFPAFYFFLREETLKAIISPDHLHWPPNYVQTHISDNCRKWSLFLLFKPTYFDFTRRLNVLPYKVLLIMYLRY